MTVHAVAVALLAACGGHESPPPEPHPEPEPAATVTTTPAPAPVGGAPGAQPLGLAPAPVSLEEADAIWAAVTAALQGQEPERETVRIDGDAVTLYHWENPRLIVSEGCAPGGALHACLALDAVRQMPAKKVQVGPGNPASYFCPAAGGKSVSAVTEAGGESGMCVFGDGSMVADWSLVYVPDFGRKAISPK